MLPVYVDEMTDLTGDCPDETVFSLLAALAVPETYVITIDF